MPSFDPEQYARPLSIAGTLAVVAGLYSGHDAGWVVVVLGVALLLTACYSRQDGFLLFGPFARADAMRTARSRRTHLVRAGIALAAGAVIVFNDHDSMPEYFRTHAPHNQLMAYLRKQIIFWFASAIGVVVPLLTVLLVSGAIAEERGKKRWEVLLTTDLRGRELVFGKLLGKLWLVVEPVVVILPVLAILPLIVGVPVHLMLLFGGAVAVTVLALAGVSVSVSSNRASRAGSIGLTVAIVGGYLFVSFVAWYAAVWLTIFVDPGVWSFPRSAGVATPVVASDLLEAVNCANPFTTYMSQAAAPPPFGSLTPSIAVALRQYSAGALGVFLVGTLLACQRVRAVRDPNRAKGVTWRTLRLYGTVEPRETVKEKRAKLRPPVTDEPLAWWTTCRVGVFRTGPTTWRRVAVAVVVMVAGYLSIYAIDIVGRNSFYQSLTRYWQVNNWPLSQLFSALPTAGLPGLLLIFAVIVPVATATQSIAKERSDDTLDSLRLTPLSAREMLDQIRAGCLKANRLAVMLWVFPASAAVVTGFFPPLAAVVLALMTLALASPLVSFALYCSAWASTPARAMRNLIFGGAVWHYLLFFAGALFVVVIPEELGFDVMSIIRLRTDPDELLFSAGRGLRAKSRTTLGDFVTLGLTAGGVAAYYLVGRWVFNRAVGRFAKSRDATA